MKIIFDSFCFILTLVSILLSNLMLFFFSPLTLPLQYLLPGLEGAHFPDDPRLFTLM